VLRSVKYALFRGAMKLRLLPRIWISRNPFKVQEFFAVTEGVAFRSDDVVLDLGCGKGIQSQIVARKCKRVVGVDTSTSCIDSAKKLLENSWLSKKVQFHCGTIQSLRLPDAAFDHLISFCVLEHIIDLNDVLNELHRIVKPNGQIHVSVDSLGNIDDPTLIARHRMEHNVVQYFTPETLRQQLEEAGFAVERAFPILTSDLAKREFQDRIRASGRYGYSFLGSMLRYRKLARMDRREATDKGIMVVCHARRVARETQVPASAKKNVGSESLQTK
jgi:ubiquinone/menaquinone biosynthesis C-methylase UbiE